MLLIRYFVRLDSPGLFTSKNLFKRWGPRYNSYSLPKLTNSLLCIQSTLAMSTLRNRSIDDLLASLDILDQ